MGVRAGVPVPGVDEIQYKSAYVRAQTRMVWLLSAPRGDSDERGLAGGVGEAGEVGGLGVAHCTGNRNEQGSELGWVRSEQVRPCSGWAGSRAGGKQRGELGLGTCSS